MGIRPEELDLEAIEGAFRRGFNVNIRHVSGMEIRSARSQTRSPRKFFSPTSSDKDMGGEFFAGATGCRGLQLIGSITYEYNSETLSVNSKYEVVCGKHIYTSVNPQGM